MSTSFLYDIFKLDALSFVSLDVVTYRDNKKYYTSLFEPLQAFLLN